MEQYSQVCFCFTTEGVPSFSMAVVFFLSIQLQRSQPCRFSFFALQNTHLIYNLLANFLCSEHVKRKEGFHPYIKWNVSYVVEQIGLSSIF